MEGYVEGRELADMVEVLKMLPTVSLRQKYKWRGQAPLLEAAEGSSWPNQRPGNSIIFT
jgi:hypothetical protein